MGAAARQGDTIQTNHEGDEYTVAAGCSSDCFVNGRGYLDTETKQHRTSKAKNCTRFL